MQLGYLQDGDFLNLQPQIARRAMRAWAPVHDSKLVNAPTALSLRSKIWGTKIVNPSAKGGVGAWAPIHDSNLMDGRGKAYGINIKGSQWLNLKR